MYHHSNHTEIIKRILLQCLILWGRNYRQKRLTDARKNASEPWKHCEYSSSRWRQTPKRWPELFVQNHVSFFNIICGVQTLKRVRHLLLFNVWQVENRGLLWSRSAVHGGARDRFSFGESTSWESSNNLIEYEKEQIVANIHNTPSTPSSHPFTGTIKNI